MTNVARKTVLSRIRDFIAVAAGQGIKAAIGKALENWFQPIVEWYYCHKLAKVSAREPIVVFLPLIDWNVPLFQRPHQLAKQFARRDFQVIFCTPNAYFDQVRGFKRIGQNLLLCSDYGLLDKVAGKRVLYTCSTDNNILYRDLENELNRDNVVVYDYIDEMHEEISGTPIPAATLAKHDEVLGDERFIVIASADKLYGEVRRRRRDNCALVTNGVDLEHFAFPPGSDAIPSAMRTILEKGARVIGYFGALASWFDYELVLNLCRQRPDYHLVLIGYVYDEAITRYRLDKQDNISVLEPVPYTELPRYARWFDVSIIPFRLNSITESTSPIKLFEYMALGKPIVTTDLPECRKYRSVLIGHDHDEFIRQIDHGLTLKDDQEYRQALRQEAAENAWDRKAGDIWHLVEPELQRTHSTGTICDGAGGVS